MYQPTGYRARVRRVRRFLLEDDRLSGTAVSSWRRLLLLRRAVAHAETGLAWPDPLFTEVHARYLDALYQVRPASRRLRELVPVMIQNACETHGHEGEIVGRLREIRALAWQRAGRAVEDEVRQAEEEVARSRGDGLVHLTAVLRLVELYERAGRYDAVIAALDALAADRTRLGLVEDEADGVDVVLAAAYLLHGEVDRATRLMERAYPRQRARGDRAGVGPGELVDDLDLHLRMARCYLGTGQPGAAESVLRESLDRLSRHLDEWQHPEVHQLRHRTLYELGKALVRQRMPREAAVYFAHACELAGADAGDVRMCRNAYTMCLLTED